MKSLIVALALAVAVPAFAMDALKTKKVCKTDPKTNKEKCKTIKVHKKLEGTKVPSKK